MIGSKYWTMRIFWIQKQKRNKSQAVWFQFPILPNHESRKTHLHVVSCRLTTAASSHFLYHPPGRNPDLRLRSLSKFNFLVLLAVFFCSAIAPNRPARLSGWPRFERKTACSYAKVIRAWLLKHQAQWKQHLVTMLSVRNVSHPSRRNPRSD